uniref:Uncharacterized protein n=1 Tax=Arundo donax TaxID=35708 RepID=A0A0A8YL22_ARUDO
MVLQWAAASRHRQSERLRSSWLGLRWRARCGGRREGEGGRLRSGKGSVWHGVGRPSSTPRGEFPPRQAAAQG